jgi:hypothetical protein
VKRLFRILIVGIFAGIAGAGALTYFVPAVDLHRERSLMSVQPNGGNSETFRINLPRDRVLVGLAGADNGFPAGLNWPSEDVLGNFQAEIFKVRDRNDVVVGVASRLASSTETAGSFIEWSLHLPARGTIYAQMEMSPSEDGFRTGIMRAGTREFEVLSGSVRERFIAEVDDGDHDVDSRIELVTALVGVLDEDVDDMRVDTGAGAAGGGK